ncbi:MAG: helix-turn-helix domain-containing protein [Phenylobacterium sp.]|uniref:TetR/AcrR family transcriptional regulator n=1 Tax=Phenylobacterium sp. TaxID=1871053 RepID=UPI0027228A69|nr:TetR/AcrR family transcriptional regulator [Phenylobacterium sp.]MDO8914280.1 helix-turn-helix domain-containing protein [Phenylobacterium sp.]MDP3102906.1 helix-turn-helix domain-containing protein [Phenylobacterium sp.]
MSSRTRTRLTPAARRDQILDVAARLIVEEGLQAATMEQLARSAGISKALVYNYFATRDVLLGALLQREQAELGARGMGAALQAQSFPELIAQTTRLYLEHVRDRGPLIAALLGDPATAALMEAESRVSRDQTVRYFVRATRRAYGLPLHRAIAAVDLLMAVTDRAGRLVAQGDLDLPTAVDMCLKIALGGLEQLARQPSDCA